MYKKNSTKQVKTLFILRTTVSLLFWWLLSLSPLSHLSPLSFSKTSGFSSLSNTFLKPNSMKIQKSTLAVGTHCNANVNYLLSLGAKDSGVNTYVTPCSSCTPASSAYNKGLTSLNFMLWCQNSTHRPELLVKEENAGGGQGGSVRLVKLPVL